LDSLTEKQNEIFRSTRVWISGALGDSVQFNLALRIWRPFVVGFFAVMATIYFVSASSRAGKVKQCEQCDPPNTYPLARRMLGRSAPGIRRASGPVPVIADVR